MGGPRDVGRFRQGPVGIVSIGALLFLSAGTLDWPGAWTFTARFVIDGLAVTLWLAWHDHRLLKNLLYFK